MRFVFTLFALAGSCFLASAGAQLAAITAMSGNVELADKIGYGSIGISALVFLTLTVWIWSREM